MDDDSFLVPLNQPIKGRRDKRALEHLEVDKFSDAQQEEVNKRKMNKMSKDFLALLDTFQALVMQQGEAMS
jgi:hypothetical protein